MQKLPSYQEWASKHLQAFADQYGLKDLDFINDATSFRGEVAVELCVAEQSSYPPGEPKSEVPVVHHTPTGETYLAHVDEALDRLERG